jgi:NCS1 family nucleobase:cation symporter-1
MSAKQQPQGDQVWSIETHGIDPITDDERHGTPSEVFWIWFAGNIGILGVTFGGILASNGLNIWQSIFVALIATAVSFLLVGILSIAGVWGGAPMLTLSRALFGPRGNIGPAVFSWLSLVGWETIIVITATYSLLELFKIAGLPANEVMTVISLLLVSLIVILLGLWGHATLVWIQRASTIIFGILTLVVVAFLVPQTDWNKLFSQPMGPWDTGLVTSFIIIMASTGIGWINAGADYTRYLPRHSSGRAITLWTVLGGTLPLFVLMIVGVMLASRKPDLATIAGPADLIGFLPAWMAIPYLITAIGGLIPAAALDIYSSGLNLLTAGIRLKRYYAVLIDGVLMVAGAIFVMLIAQNFFTPFYAFVTLMAAGLTTWAAIFLIDMLPRREYDAASLADTSENSKYFFTAGFNLPACIAWLIGVAVGFLFTSSALFTGPFATGIFASTSLGYLLGAVVGALLYLVLRRALPSKQAEVAPDVKEEERPAVS